MMMVMVVSAHRLRQILHVRQLAALRGVGEVRRQLIELVGSGRIAVRQVSLSCGLQVRGDLLRDLLVFARVRLLKLLEHAHQLGEWRKLAAVRWPTDTADTVLRRLVGQAGALKRGAENRL